MIELVVGVLPRHVERAVELALLVEEGVVGATKGVAIDVLHASGTIGDLLHGAEVDLHGCCRPSVLGGDAHLELQTEVGEIAEVGKVADARILGIVLRIAPVTCPVFEREVAVVPAAIVAHGRLTKDEVVARERGAVAGDGASMPAVVAQHGCAVLPRCVEVEEHATVIHILEGALRLSIDGLHAHLLVRHALRHDERDAILRDAGDGRARQHIVAKVDREREFLVVEEVVADDGDLLACGSPFVRHRRDYGSRNDDVEVVSHRVLALGDEVDLIGHQVGNLVRHGDDERVVGHIARVEHSGLVVEEQRGDAAQVLTDDAHGGAHRGGGDDRVLCLYADGADEVDGWLATLYLVGIGLVLARRDGQRGAGCQCKAKSFEYIVCFHITIYEFYSF